MNCASCGAALPEGAMFCGNCGRAVHAAPIPKTRVADPRPSDTTVLKPGMSWSQLRDAAVQTVPETAEPEEEAGHPDGDASPSDVRIADVPVTKVPVDDLPAAQVPVTAFPVIERSGAREAARSDAAADARNEAAEKRSRTTEESYPTMPRPIIPPVPYVLSFSTGERVVVVGPGLLGRRPFTQPGERFDQLVSIADYERSVSKTHLEFGLEDDQLWICDRYSANGTVIIPPAGGPHRCEPGRRYRVPRGGRVEIGDHWFDVR